MSLQGSDKPTFLLLKARIPAVNPGHLIGRFVTHPARPLDNFAPSDPSKIIGNEIVELEERLTTDVVDQTKDAHARAALESLVDLGAKAKSKDGADIRGKYIKTYRLQNHYKAFDRLEVDESVREALDGPKGLFTRSKGKLYMIVGYKACRPKTSFKLTHTGSGSFLAKVTLPLSAFLTQLPLNMTDPTVETGLGGSHSQIQGFTTKDEQIFAIEYKVVTQRNIFGMYSAKAETVMAHNPSTYNWNNAMFDVKKGSVEIEGKFDDEEESEDVPDAEPVEDDRALDMKDDSLTIADLQGEEFLILEWPQDA